MQEIEDLKNQQNLLIQQKYEYVEKIKEIEKNIKQKGYEIANTCKNKDDGHKWISEREEGPYGERFTYCEKCRVDYYGNYFH